MFCLNENNIYRLYSQGIDTRKGVEGRVFKSQKNLYAFLTK